MSLKFDITDYVGLNGPVFFEQRFPSWEFVREHLSDSEPWCLYFHHTIDDKKLYQEFSKLVQPLEEVYGLFDRWEQASPKNKELIDTEIRSLNLPQTIGRFKSGFIGTKYGAANVAEIMNIGDTAVDLESYVDSLFVHLPKGAILLENNPVHSQDSKGCFVAFGWNPRQHEVYFAGPDYCRSKRKLKLPRLIHGYQSSDIFEYEKSPEGRGLPTDVIESDSNCGPSALAAYLNISCAEAIKLTPLYREKGYISPTPMRGAFNNFGMPHVLKTVKGRSKSLVQVMRKHGSKGLALIKFFDKKPETGFIANINTHWIAIDGEKIYDVNAPQYHGMGNWMREDQWQRFIMPMVFNAFPGTTDFFVKNVLVPKN